MTTVDDAKTIIMRRRARFLAATLGGLATLAVAPTARAEGQNDAAKGTDKEVASFARGSFPECVAFEAIPKETLAEVRGALEEATALKKKGNVTAALAVARRARERAFIADVAEVEAQLHVDAGHFAMARSLLEARVKCEAASGPLPEALAARLADLRMRTAEVHIDASGHVKIDGADIGPAPALIFVAAGSHEIEIETFDGTVTKRSLAFAGGETEHIEVPGGEPRVCLSIAIRDDRTEAGPLGITIAPTMLMDVTGEDRGGPLTVGGAIAPFARVALSSSVEVRLGAFVAPSGSSRGFTMPIGGFTSARIYPGSLFSIGLGAAAGYLVAPSPSRATVRDFEAAPSVYIEPHVPISISIGNFEIENRIGMIICGQEDAERARFAPSYVSFSLGLTWLPRRQSRHDE